jgi:hypothetical protein
MRQRIIEDFYGGVRMEYRLMQHVWRACASPWEFIAYMACLSRIYMPETKERHSGSGSLLGSLAPAPTGDPR